MDNMLEPSTQFFPLQTARNILTKQSDLYMTQIRITSDSMGILSSSSIIYDT